MERVDLESSLNQPPCPTCQVGHVRPFSINDNTLWFNCSRCGWRARAQLPDIQKTIVYLDTSTLSHIASSLRSGARSGKEWRRLYEVLCQGTTDEILCCVCSSISEREAELTPRVSEILQISGTLCSCSVRHEFDIQHGQLLRALDDYLGNTKCSDSISLPWQDAFEEDPHQWQELFRIDLCNRRPPQEQLQARRLGKSLLCGEVSSIYSRYAEEELDFDRIRQLEADGYGRGLLNEGYCIIKNRLDALASGVSLEPLDLLPTMVDLIVGEVQHCLGIGLIDAFEKAADFLRSNHVSRTPIADIGARLHAAIAIAARGRTPRKPSPGDAADIAHVATFAPYVDILIADGFVAGLCGQPTVGLRGRYKARIRSLGAKEVDGFCTEVESLRRRCQHLDLVGRVHRSIEKG